MKRNRLIHDLHATFKIALRFGRQHFATLNMIEGTYIRQLLPNERVAGVDATLTIKPYGSFYRVTRIDYLRDSEDSWLATYGWHSNGHLIEIGGDRHCIFDAASGALYLESLTEQADTTLELFIKSSYSRGSFG